MVVKRTIRIRTIKVIAVAVTPFLAPNCMKMATSGKSAKPETTGSLRAPIAPMKSTGSEVSAVLISPSAETVSARCVYETGDTVTDLNEDLAAEQKARTTYENLLRLVDDPDVRDVLKFLREREVVHYQRFGELLRIAQENLDSNNFYAFNPSFCLLYTSS